MKKQIGLLAIIALLVTFMAFSGVASAQSSNVQVVFFTSPYCSACQAAHPIAEAAAAKYGVTLVTYDVTDNGQGKGVAAANGVTETPTIIVSGAQTARIIDPVTPEKMEAAIKAAVGTTTVKQAVATAKATPTPVKQAVATVKATPTPVKQAATPTTVKQVVATVTDPTKQVTAVKAVAAATTKQPTIEVVTANQTSTTATQTVPEFSLLGLGAPALLVGAIYLFLRRR
jgi:thiol-disulfide isomerase/thioredoxin